MNEEYKKMFKSLWLILKTKSVDELNFFVQMPEDKSPNLMILTPNLMMLRLSLRT